ncbi:transcription termination factor 2-like isoform X1 [Prorops nasuta]|uniref:transcription termination factor 2-like isoform X1 n=1 Tax=Prorops nasuta TaxID=863751 RepID=UPI0034CE68E1
MGTSIHNKELDLYVIVKFLKCSPFNHLNFWKSWVDSDDATSLQKLAIVMKNIMLQRIKQDLQNKGEIKSLLSKSLEVIEITLDTQEELAYGKMLVYSRMLGNKFLAQS